eukprot:GEZU01005056.1.p1 GENE.GEZU01005056.1~~GEZU01005056.1.p1  ORF type:complete len:827 (+),score=228.62 GEZU01005056.1:93-2573(+)
MDPFKLSSELSGHESDVRGVCSYELHEGGVATASLDHTVKVWKPKAGSKPPVYECETTLVGHTNFVGAVVYVPGTPQNPAGNLVSASHDSHIIVWDVAMSAPVKILEGHTAAVSCLTATPTGELISGSWDHTARVWRNYECVHVLKGHTANVLCVLGLSNGDILTGSGDRTIKRWRDGKEVQTISGHSDGVRGLAEVPGIGFISASNDTTLRLWSYNGECLQEFHGHTNQVYSVCVLAVGEYASGSEDKTLKIWKDGECVQTIAHPGCVWDVKQLPNGDIISACSDRKARIFTRSKDRIALPETIKAFEDQLAKQEVSTKLVGGVDLDKLKGPEELQKPGARDGVTKIIRSAQNKAEVYQWSQADRKWIKIGDLVDPPGTQGGKTYYNGKWYDYVFDVNIEDEKGQSRNDKIGYNRGENPYAVAQQYIWDNKLNQDWLDQIAQHIINNSDMSAGAAAPGYQDPFTGGSRYVPGGGAAARGSGFQDPLTGGGRYIPGSGGAQRPQQQAPPSSYAFSTYAKEALARKQQQQQPAQGAGAAGKNFPQTTPVLFDAIDFLDKIHAKLVQFNNELAQAGSPAALNEKEQAALNDLCGNVLKSKDFGNTAIHDAHVQLFVKLLQWPVDKVFPVVDLLRIFILHKNAAAGFVQQVVNRNIDLMAQLIDKCFDPAVTGSLPPATTGSLQMLCLRFVANAFSPNTTGVKNLVVRFAGQILDRIKVVLHATDPKIRVVLIGALFNMTTYYHSVDGGEQVDQLLTALAETLKSEANPGNVVRIICGMGNLITSPQNKARAKQRAKSLLLFEAMGARRIGGDQKVIECAEELMQVLQQ